VARSVSSRRRVVIPRRRAPLAYLRDFAHFYSAITSSSMFRRNVFTPCLARPGVSDGPPSTST